MPADLLSIRPFETCSIRPPTENYSLTFRLTRNCYWNKCKFCPVYKFGAKFSKRTAEDVLDDIANAKRIDDAMLEYGIGIPFHSDADYQRASDLIERIKLAWREAGMPVDEPEAERQCEVDPRLAWFLQWFREKPKIEECVNSILTWRIAGGRTCFLGDSDSLILKPDYFNTVLSRIKASFPGIERFTVYGRTKSASSLRSLEELRDINRAGIDRIHFGLESGCDRVLEFMKKGVTKSEHIEGLSKAREAGFSVSVYVMPGLGGSEWSEAHASDTADVINRSRPHFVRLRSLEVFPQTELEGDVKNSRFTVPDEPTVVNEIRILVESIDARVHFYSDSASNLLQINGTLPDDRGKMMRILDHYTSLSERERLEFSFHSRLESFYGQYGFLTQDIEKSLLPYINDGQFDISRIPQDELREIILLIRSKLMP